jgi:hypothetical protein
LNRMKSEESVVGTSGPEVTAPTPPTDTAPPSGQ